MKKGFLIMFCTMTAVQISMAQEVSSAPDTSWKNIYRATTTKVNDLVHTKLDVRFDFSKAHLYGKAWVTLKPHFYATDSLTLDAKGMDIKEVAIMKGNAKSPLKYTYDSLQLFIKLDKKYSGNDKYTVYIAYVSRPNDIKSKGSAAITDSRGLYFINPKGEDKTKPTQVWTQGETENNSVWMPTIDKPNQKSTEEIYMTVPAKYVTLSNGLLISKKNNADGTRTDYWKMDLPHAPYLFFMGIGDFAVIKDSYKGKEVSYYVEKDQAAFAKGVFGNTSEMMKVFSEKLGIDFPWAKYAQMVGRDYVSGAMENTTATLHQESAYQNARQLTDGNSWEGTIAHELFHQWLGDLVTAESWSNLTVNESFANFSECIWFEYKYGKDFADAHNYDDMEGYLFSESADKDLVRFKYADKEDMFDAVSYNKGGRILQMLRNYVGDDAFFKSVNNYLTTNKFKTGEAAQLRLAFEEVTGKDLNWFWNQWYYGSGHPKLDISYKYDAANEKAYVFVNQVQEGNKIFKLPIAIDVYIGKDKERHNVWLQNRADTFIFNYGSKPELINVDADKILLCEKTDNKSTEEYVFQYKHAPNYLDRKEALDYFEQNGKPELALGISDKFSRLRSQAINALGRSEIAIDDAILKQVEENALTDKNKKSKAAAIRFLAQTADSKYLDIFKRNVNDSSYSVAGAALEGLSKLEPAKAYETAKKYTGDAKGALGRAVADIIMANGDEKDFDYVSTNFDESPTSQEKVGASITYCNYLKNIADIEKVKKGIDHVIKFRNEIPAQYHVYVDPAFKKGFDGLSKAKGKVIEEYIKQVFK
ncbi:M1 family aminopeptidase [Ferruginibacter sp. SUN002]|uniref:M1 family aminopeptidase n=1 Tax=Ferruginibacter sp. SUN002 TaxID=2937789 RepID=UPI003D35B6F3